MQQVLQELASGKTVLADVPAPGSAARRSAHRRPRRSLISAGTERMLVDFGKAGWIDKARQQPDKVRMVLDKIRTDGLLPTLEAVRSKLDQPLPLGYCNVGVVVEVGEGVAGFAVGDRVVSNGKHAEIVARAGQSLRAGSRRRHATTARRSPCSARSRCRASGLSQPTLGETVVVTGLGLIGLLTVQLLRAHGCRVLGLDLDAAQARARAQLRRAVRRTSSPARIRWRRRRRSRAGAASTRVLITAATDSSEPVHQAALMCRKRGRIVLVGVAGLELSRADFYEKELTFQVSCSYGPGRYDPAYEEQRQRLSDRLRALDRAAQLRGGARHDGGRAARRRAADLASLRDRRRRSARTSWSTAREPSLGILLDYPRRIGGRERRSRTRGVARPRAARRDAAARVECRLHRRGQLRGCGADPGLQGGRRAAAHDRLDGGRQRRCMPASKFGFEQATTDVACASSPTRSVDAVVIATRHDTHAALRLQALRAGKHVFVEKPLRSDARRARRDRGGVARARRGERPPLLMVGFNRRFAPQVAAISALARPRAPSPRPSS